MTLRRFTTAAAAVALTLAGLAVAAPRADAMEAVFDVGDLVLSETGCTDHEVTSNFTFTDSDAPTRTVLYRVLDPKLEQIHQLRVEVQNFETQRVDHFTFCPAELVSGTYTVTATVVSEVQARSAINDKWSTTFEVYVPPKTGPTTTEAAATRAGTAMLRKVDRGIRLVLTGGTFEQDWLVKVRLGRDHTYITSPGTSLIRTFRWTTGRHTVKVYTDGQLVVKRAITVR